jgi:Flp pilus assembly protein TadG
MKNFWRKFRRDEKAAALVLVALMLAVLMGFTAMVVDAGIMFQNRRYLQNVADAAALAGAAHLAGDRDAADSEAIKYVQANGYDLAGAVTQRETYSTTVTTPNGDEIIIKYSDDFKQITVTPKRTVDYVFGKALGLTNKYIGASATAEKGEDPFWLQNPGIISFEDGEEPGVEIKGSVILGSNDGHILIHSNSTMEIKENVTKTVGTEVYGSATDSLQDKSGIFDSTQEGVTYEPPLTAEMLADLKSQAEELGQYFDEKVEIDPGETINWTGVVYIDNKLQVDSGTITGGALIIVRDSIEFKGNCYIEGAFYNLDTSGSGIEFKDEPVITVVGSVMSLGKIEILDDVILTVIYDGGFVEKASLAKDVRLIL